MIVMKFGGTSIGSGQRILNVAKIVSEHHRQQPVVVVSAISQVTNLLAGLVSVVTLQQPSRVKTSIGRLRQVHYQAARALKLEPTAQAELLRLVDSRLAELENVLASMALRGELTPKDSDLVASFGERLSIHLVVAALRQTGVNAKAVEASSLIVSDDTFGQAGPLLPASRQKVKSGLQALINNNITPVITGFIAATAKGAITTLGRGGSDYSATIIGYCLEAEEVWIWTDVDGVMTADPRLVKGARTVNELSYDEAAELSYFGAKVLHPRTMIPAALGNMPILIKNTLQPAVRGTRISNASHYHPDGAKVMTVLNHLSLITVQGKGMQGVLGVAARVFTTLAKQKVNVLFISQASSENNISLVTSGQDGAKAAKALRQVFRSEFVTKNLETVREEPDLSMIAVVGEGLRNHAGIAGRVFSALGQAKINVTAIAQGSSELNISLVVSEAKAKQALQSIHDELHLANGKNAKLNKVAT